MKRVLATFLPLTALGYRSMTPTGTCGEPLSVESAQVFIASDRW